jgi:oligopeptide transport system ATP-binding protein
VPLLDVQGLRVEFRTQRGAVHAVNGVDLTLQAGQTVGLVGESGCGKSVTALAVLGLLPAPAGRVTAGSVLFEGRDLIRLREHDLQRVRGRNIAMVFQDPMTSLNPVMTVGKQLTEVLRAHFPLDRRQARRRAVELLDQVGIPSASRRLDDYPHQFSGGMRQRVMVALAVACQPKLLIADEPTTALDVTIQAQILALLRQLIADTDMALLLITHDLGVVAGTCERANVMYAGQIVESGTTQDLFSRPKHPYTLGLLRSIPRLDGPRKAALAPIAGLPASLTAPPTSCPFAPRCPRRLDDVCWQLPALAPVPEAASDQRAACFNPVPEPDHAAQAR